MKPQNAVVGVSVLLLSLAFGVACGPCDGGCRDQKIFVYPPSPVSTKQGDQPRAVAHDRPATPAECPHGGTVTEIVDSVTGIGLGDTKVCHE